MGSQRLAGKIAIVTGAAQGIGRAIATRLADEGAPVAIADIQTDAAERTAAELRTLGAKAIAVKLDVTKFDDAEAAASTVERELGPIDILVNNAGWDKLEAIYRKHARDLGQDYRDQLSRHAELLPRDRAANESARIGQDRFDLFRRRPRRLDRRGGVRRMQGGDYRILEDHRA